MSFAYTPSLSFDGSTFDSARMYFSSGDDVYDDYGISQIQVHTSDFTFYFINSTKLSDWRGTDRGVQFEYTGSGSKGWEGTYDLTSSEESSVGSTTLTYSTSSVVGSSSNAATLADDVASNGNGSSILNINNLG